MKWLFKYSSYITIQILISTVNHHFVNIHIFGLICELFFNVFIFLCINVKKRIHWQKQTLCDKLNAPNMSQVNIYAVFAASCFYPFDKNACSYQHTAILRIMVTCLATVEQRFLRTARLCAFYFYFEGMSGWKCTKGKLPGSFNGKLNGFAVAPPAIVFNIGVSTSR